MASRVESKKIERAMKHMKSSFQSTLVMLSCCASSMVSAQLPNQAAPPVLPTTNDFDLRFGGGRTDNVRRVRMGQQSDTFSVVGLSGQFNRARPRIDMAVTADIERRNFSDGTLKDEPYGEVNADVEVYALPDRVSWLFSENYGQGRLDPFDALGPLNQEQINVFSTGPRFNMPLGGRTVLGIAGTRAARSFEETKSLDSDTTSGELTISRAVGSTTTLGFSATSRKIEYTLALFDSRINAAYLSYQRQLVSGSAELALGKSSVDFGATETSSPYVNMSWNRAFGTRSSISLAATNQLGDVGDGFGRTSLAPIAGQNVNSILTLLSADVFEESSASIAYTISLPRATLALASSIAEADYVNDNVLDSEWQLWSLAYQRNISSRLTFSLDVSVSRRDFRLPNQQEDNNTARFGLQRIFGRRMSLDFIFERYNVSDEGPLEIDENMLRVIFRYRLNGQPRGNVAALVRPH